MWKLFFKTTRLLTIVVLISLAACSNNQATNPIPNSIALAKKPPTKPKTKLSVKQSKPTNAHNSLQQALDTATGAVTISQSALSRDDWNLVARRWQEAINLLKNVSASSRQYKTAQKKLKEYRNYLADAKLRATPAPRKSCSGDTNPLFFSVPIHNRIGGTPLVEVSFNENQKFLMLFDTGASHTLVTRTMATALRLPPLGISRMTVADGSVVTLVVARVNSQAIDGHFRMDVPVAVAPAEAQYGLLGQDFFKGYDVAIKENVIEFRRQSNNTKVYERQTSCSFNSNPKAFFVPIIGHRNNVPIVNVTFNDQYQFPMLFDTGASSTLITNSMARKMRLIPANLKRSGLADGSVVEFPTAFVKSQRISTRLQRDVEVAVAPPDMDIGLLGQDFFAGYNFTIKENVIEFRQQMP
jgi:predicted aspartyl protease